jgi:DNA-directed RNA polymerase subunit K/omega
MEDDEYDDDIEEDVEGDSEGDSLSEDEDVDEVSVPETKYDTSRGDNRIIVKVVKNPEDRKTSNHMSLYEYASLIGIRGQMIENGDLVFVEIGDMTDSISIAKQELREKMHPLSVVREISRKGNVSVVEVWSANELICDFPII